MITTGVVWDGVGGQVEKWLCHTRYERANCFQSFDTPEKTLSKQVIRRGKGEGKVIKLRFPYNSKDRELLAH